MMGGRYDLAERFANGWHASSADGSRSTSGYRVLEAVLDDLEEGAWIIDGRRLEDDPRLVGWVLGAPMHGDPAGNGRFLADLEAAPWMMAVVANYGLAGSTAVQARHSLEGREGYGPLDYAPASWLAGYWHDRGALIRRWVHGSMLDPWGPEVMAR